MSPVKKFSIGGAVGIAIGLIGTGVQWRWPEYKDAALALIFGGTALLVIAVVAAIVRTMTIREYERQHQHPPIDPFTPPTQKLAQTAPISNTNNPVFAPVFAPSFNQSQVQSQSAEPAVTENSPVQSEIDCTDCYFVSSRLSGWNRLSDDTGQECIAAQADFYLKPIPRSEPWLELRTQLVFYDAEGKTHLCRVSDGVWKDHGNFIQMPLRTGDTRKLVLAIDIADTGLNSYEYAEKHLGRRRFTTEGIFTHILAPKVQPLRADKLTVKVVLSGKYLEQIILNQEFWFRLSRLEHKIERIASPRGIETDIKLQY